MLAGTLKLNELERIVIDGSYIDSKKRGIFDMRETHLPLLQLLTRDEFRDRYGAKQKGVKILVFWFYFIYFVCFLALDWHLSKVNSNHTIQILLLSFTLLLRTPHTPQPEIDKANNPNADPPSPPPFRPAEKRYFLIFCFRKATFFLEIFQHQFLLIYQLL